MRTTTVGRRPSHPRPRLRHTTLTLLGLTLCGVLLTACSDDDGADPPPTGSTSSPSSSPSPSTPVLQDRSREVVDGAVPLSPIATTEARADSSFRGSTFTVYRLTRTDSSTLLVWRVTGGSGSSSPSDASVRSWERYPVMVAGDQELSVVTFDKEADGWSAVSNPILRIEAGTEGPPQSALYPPLPEGTTQVTLRGVWFEDVTVPVTDAS